MTNKFHIIDPETGFRLYNQDYQAVVDTTADLQTGDTGCTIITRADMSKLQIISALEDAIKYIQKEL